MLRCTLNLHIIRPVNVANMLAFLDQGIVL